MNWKLICVAASMVALSAAASAQTTAPATQQQRPPAAQQQQRAPAAQQQRAPAAAPAPRTLAESVAAIVNDEVISTYDVRQRAYLLLLSAGVEANQQMLDRARNQALQELIDERLQMQETKTFEINVTDAEVTRRIGDIARSNNTTPDAFVQRLNSAGVNVATLRAQIRADIAWNRLMGGLYGSRLRISDVEVRATQARIAASATSTHYLISEIFLPAGTEQEFAQMQNGGMRLIEQMQQGAPFPLVARQFSAAPSAAAGGDIGWIAANELAPEVAAVAERLQPNQVSLPIRAQNGVYIIALREKREGQPAGASSRITLRQVTAPSARRAQLERFQRSINGCASIEREIASIEGAQSIDLGATAENDLSPQIRQRIGSLAPGRATQVQVVGEVADTIVVCARETGGAGVPSRQEVENRLYEQELAMLSERYLRNLRREATIITRNQQQQPQQGGS